MPDKYEQWLMQRIADQKDLCMDEAAKIGYPNKYWAAPQAMRYELEAFEEALEKYQEISRDKHHE
jgi:hypothetical protein